MSFTAAQHHNYANQHLLAAQGKPSSYDNSDLSSGQHYSLARQHRNAGRGLPSNFDKIDAATAAPKVAGKKLTRAAITRINAARKAKIAKTVTPNSLAEIAASLINPHNGGLSLSDVITNIGL